MQLAFHDKHPAPDNLTGFGDALDGAAAKAEIIKAVSALKNYYLADRLQQIEKQISQAEKLGESEQVQILLEEFKLLTEEQKELGAI